MEPKSNQLYIYRVKRPDNTYYVGSTYQLEERLQSHEREGAKDIIYRPCDSDSYYHELNLTLKSMYELGIEKVYGACFANENRTEEQIAFIKSLMNFLQNACYKCVKIGHYSRYCWNYSR